MNGLESGLRWFLGVATALVLVVLLQGVVSSQRRPAGRTTGSAERVLRPWAEALIGVGFFGASIILWRPLPVEPRGILRAVAAVTGGVLAGSGLALVLWGRLALGSLYGVSSAVGARLHADHRLITHGPFAYVRHPMYLGIQLASLGGLLLCRTWTMVFLNVAFLGLIVRARREDDALRLEFGEEWEAYRSRVPGWLPGQPRRRHRRSPG
jgi:protein-S-isoprenylcysteine O-methyltransferase